MFDGLESMLNKVTGGSADPQAVGDAADQHIGTMDPDELTGHLQTAAGNLRQSGENDLAQQIEGMIQRKQVDPDELKAAAVTLIRENPQIIARFAPPFAQGILSKLGI